MVDSPSGASSTPSGWMINKKRVQLRGLESLTTKHITDAKTAKPAAAAFGQLRRPPPPPPPPVLWIVRCRLATCSNRLLSLAQLWQTNCTLPCASQTGSQAVQSGTLRAPRNSKSTCQLIQKLTGWYFVLGLRGSAPAPDFRTAECLIPGEEVGASLARPTAGLPVCSSPGTQSC